MDQTRPLARRVLDAVVAFATGACCAVCDAPLDAPTTSCVCAACWHDVEVGAVTPLTSDARLPLVSCGAYDGRLREIIHAFKYRGHQALARPLADLMRTVGAHVLGEADCVIPVPLHWRRRLTRGFNQAELLARHLGPPVRRVLRRTRATRPQRLLPAEARRRNVDAAFASCWDGPIGRGRYLLTRVAARALAPHVEEPSLSGLAVVLVDDVCTTGSTLVACAQILRSAGAREVRALTVARVESGRPA